MTTVEIEVHALEKLAPYRISVPIDYLKRQVFGILDIVGREKRCAVAGGAVARALLGNVPHDCDFDLFVARQHYPAALAALEAAGARQDFGPESSAAGASPDHQRMVGTMGVVDVVACTSVADSLARFDLRCCAVATDGITLLARAGALDDLRTRTLVPTRTTAWARFQRYLQLGLDPRGLPAGRDIDDVLRDGLPGWVSGFGGVFEHNRTRDQALGLDLEIDVRFADMRAIT